MKIKYCGGRSRYEVSINRKPYYFAPENGKILETKDQGLINYIFSLDNRHEFSVVEEEEAQVIIKEPEAEAADEQTAPTPVHAKPVIIKKIGKHKKGRK